MAADALERAMFDRAMDEFVLPHEGGFVMDPDDPGGATNYGISLRWLKAQGELDGDLDDDGDIDEADIQVMTPNQARKFYYKGFWLKFGFNQLPGPVAIKTFDLGVNMGPRQAIKLLQRAVRAASRHEIKDDGFIGPTTVQAVQSCDEFELLAAYRAQADQFYRGLAERRPAFKKFIRGWLKRAHA